MLITLLFAFFSTWTLADPSANECAIIANGPPLTLERVTPLLKGKTVIALDGAANTLYKFYAAQIEPDFILGDFDSISPEAIQYYSVDSKSHPKFITASSQELTDLEKGIIHCDQLKALSIIIFNALGTSRMDHTLANISFLKKYYRSDRPIQIHAESEVIEYSHNQTLSFSGEKGSAVGIFGFPQAQVSSQGLQWDLENFKVQIGETQSSSNYIRNSEVSLTVQGDILVTRPYN